MHRLAATGAALRAAAVRSLTVLGASVLAFAACTPATDTSSNAAVYDAWRDHRSRVEVTAYGAVARILGARSGRNGPHLGFLLHLAGGEGRGLTVRVEDNLDLTGPIPLRDGELASVRGEYIYDSRGGLIHYTHRDPRGRHDAGYVEADGRIYQ